MKTYFITGMKLSYIDHHLLTHAKVATRTSGNGTCDESGIRSNVIHF